MKALFTSRPSTVILVKYLFCLLCFSSTAAHSYSFTQCSPGFEDISGGGTRLVTQADFGGNADDGQANVTLPFQFTYYDVASTALRIGTNGGILFNATTGTLLFTNTDIPNNTPPLAILPFWDDLNLQDNADNNATPPPAPIGVYYETRGTAPNRRFIVQWHDIHHYNRVGAVTFQVVLYEGSNEINFVYQDVDFGDASFDNGVSATIGLNKDASEAEKFSFNTASLSEVEGLCLASDQDYGDAPASYGSAQHSTPHFPELEPVVVPDVDATAVTVSTVNTYSSPIVVCTYSMELATDTSAVVRVSNVTSNSFDVRIQEPRDSVNVTPGDVYCLVAEEGAHTLPDGRSFEARTKDTVVPNSKAGSPNPNPANDEVSSDVSGTYSNPVVLGQVMTENDSNFSYFWSNDCESRLNPPFDTGMADGICVNNHIGEDTGVPTRLSEKLGYIVVEAGSGSYGGVFYETALGADSVRGVGAPNTPPYSYTLGQTYDFAVATQEAMDGPDGAWAVLFGADPLSSNEIDLASLEDQIGDAERSHATEQLAYWALTLSDQPFLGAVPGDPELATQSTAAADGDDSNGADDEEGVVFRSPAGSGESIYADVTVTNSAGGTVSVCAWLDVPSGGSVDGVFDASDGSCMTTSAVHPILVFQWSGLPEDSAYTTYARFRVSSDVLATTEATGAATDGEVEDYRVIFDFQPTAVAVGKVELRARKTTEFLAGLNVDKMSSDAVMALLHAWDPVASDRLANADRQMIVSALLNYLDPDGDNQVAVLYWDTLEERGTIGFYVERREGGGDWQRINNDMLPGLITAPMGGQYQLADPGARPGMAYQYRLIEQEARGTTRSYGPYRIEML